jgi:C-terminal processing protease CtpA/Prc
MLHVQVVPLDEEDGSAVIVTVARYQTPNGIDINKVGIQPDLPLDSDALAPGRANVCSVLRSDAAPRLFK